MKPHTLIVIVGPTAIGKTALAIAVARHFSTAIISADSRQFFKEMSIGTAKPSADELAAAPHYFIDSHTIRHLFSTGEFELAALDLLEELFTKHNVAVMIGGSGLYINAVCNGLDELPEIDLEIRESLNKMLEEEGLAAIQQQLKAADPVYYDKVDQQNPQRMIRGLEVFLSTGTKLSDYLTHSRKERPFNIIKVGLNTDRATLYDRINKRVDIMMESGLLDEVKSLEDFKSLNALKTVGYTELFDHLDGKITLQEAVDSIKQNTRRFAKRQLTWFNKDKEIRWFEPTETEAVLSYLDERLSAC